MAKPESRRRGLVYGRRQGHALSPRQQALTDELLPKISVDLDRPAVDQLDAARPLWLEIGFGGGEHLAWQAERRPDVLFLGCEPFVNGVAKLLVAVEEVPLANVRIHDDDARAVLDWLPADSVDRCFILYPDPWHKKRHNKRRFIGPENLERLARVMKPGAELRVASDIPDYVRWSLEHIARDGRFEWTARRPADWRDRPDDWPPTRYEQKAVREGRTPAYLIFRRV